MIGTQAPVSGGCLRCGGVYVQGAWPDLPPSCLSCGRPPPGSRPEPLPLIVGREPRRRSSDASVRERILAVLAAGPLHRERIYAAIPEARPSFISAKLAALRQEGLVVCERDGSRQAAWRLADGEEYETCNSGESERRQQRWD